MGKILCSTRGGEDSLRTQEAAIDLAKRLDDELIFFIAYDMEFMAHASVGMRSDLVSDEMTEMCDFLMAMAVERAEAKGVTARYVVREGSFREELKEVALEEKVDIIVLGRPGSDPSGAKLIALEGLCASIQIETGIPAVVLPESELIKR